MKKKTNRLTNIFTHIALILLSLSCVIPFLLVVSVSFTSESGINSNGYSLIPSEFSLEAYRYIFANPGEVLSAYKITITVTAIGTILGTLISAMLAYPISRKDFKLSRHLSFYVYFTMLFSGGMVPTYLLVSKTLGMKDTILALIFPILLNAFDIFLLRTFFSDIPKELIEAATIDGANELKIFFEIIIPIGKVGIAMIALFSVLRYWNDWFQSMLYIDKSDIQSLQYMLYRVMRKTNLAKEMGGSVMFTEKIPNENLRMALCVVAAGPVLFVFPFFQKYFAKGITVGAVKG